MWISSKSFYRSVGLISAFFLLLNLAQPVSAQTSAVCTDLSSDLFQGMSDSGYDKSVSKLQSYLFKAGYLTATPNGYFGASTRAAVKKLQANNSIDQTGRAGPATRRAIRDRSCNGAQSVMSPNLPATASASGNNLTAAINSNQSINVGVDINKRTVVSPSANSTLIAGGIFHLQWKNYPGAIYDVLLEDKNGVGAGYISSSISGDGYDWEVGKVRIAQTDVIAEPGVYQIHLRSSSYSTAAVDQYSGLFTVAEKPIIINSVIPPTVSGKADVSVVIIGSNFNETSMVNYDVYNSGRVAKPVYISQDGKILVFTVTKGVYPSQYSLTVNNRYASGATSSPSNQLNFVVNN